MTTPIDPGDTGALSLSAELLVDTFPAFARLNPMSQELARASARLTAKHIARAVVPDGFVVVAVDDLRAVLDHGIIGWQSGLIAPHGAYDRLRAAIGGEE